MGTVRLLATTAADAAASLIRGPSSADVRAELDAAKAASTLADVAAGASGTSGDERAADNAVREVVRLERKLAASLQREADEAKAKAAASAEAMRRDRDAAIKRLESTPAMVAKQEMEIAAIALDLGRRYDALLGHGLQRTRDLRLVRELCERLCETPPADGSAVMADHGSPSIVLAIRRAVRRAQTDADLSPNAIEHLHELVDGER